MSVMSQDWSDLECTRKRFCVQYLQSINISWQVSKWWRLASAFKKSKKAETWASCEYWVLILEKKEAHLCDQEIQDVKMYRLKVLNWTLFHPGLGCKSYHWTSWRWPCLMLDRCTCKGCSFLLFLSDDKSTVAKQIFANTTIATKRKPSLYVALWVILFQLEQV